MKRHTKLPPFLMDGTSYNWKNRPIVALKSQMPIVWTVGTATEQQHIIKYDPIFPHTLHHPVKEVKTIVSHDTITILEGVQEFLQTNGICYIEPRSSIDELSVMGPIQLNLPLNYDSEYPPHILGLKDETTYVGGYYVILINSPTRYEIYTNDVVPNPEDPENPGFAPDRIIDFYPLYDIEENIIENFKVRFKKLKVIILDPQHDETFNPENPLITPEIIHGVNLANTAARSATYGGDNVYFIAGDETFYDTLISTLTEVFDA